MEGEELGGVMLPSSLWLSQQHLFDCGPLREVASQEPELYEGSCLDVLPKIEAGSIDFILTSPPYANRYDYTRTYALELVYLGCSEEEAALLLEANRLNYQLRSTFFYRKLKEYNTLVFPLMIAELFPDILI